MKNILILLSLTLLVSCTGNLEKNRAKLDEVYGKCDNPSRTYTEKQYKQCVISENAKANSFSNIFLLGISDLNILAKILFSSYVLFILPSVFLLFNARLLFSR